MAKQNTNRIFFDLTTSYHFTGNPTGIARVEQRAFEALVQLYGERVVPVTWNSKSRNFVIVDMDHPFTGTDVHDVHQLEKAGKLKTLSECPPPPDAKYIILGGAWIRNKHYVDSLIRLKRNTKVGISILVHDLIQMKLSYLYPDGAGKEFTENAKRLVGLADNFLCYSKATKNDLTAFLAEQEHASKTISMIGLGDMTDRLQQTTDDEESVLQWRFGKKEFCLFVSSIDPRKNHILLLNVWRKLVNDRGDKAPHLVLIGRPMWKSEDIVSIAIADEALSKFVHILSDVNDNDLNWFYKNTLFTVYPSLYEGWGLPIAESLSYGKFCIASNSTSTAEVAPELTDLLDPYDYRAWLDKICFYLDNRPVLSEKEQRIKDTYKAHPWSTSVREIVGSVENLPVVEDGFSIAPLEEIVEARIGGGQLSEKLQIALAQTFIPTRLPPTRLAFRVLRAFKIDWFVLKIYRKMMNRTNDSIRRVIEEIQEMQR
ncbi:glycosyltransferase family 4 protein [Brucella pituitosa]|uniref:glycosyltransferase family 4 protein n=1 Tax=Brucella pituitosa TaxID=571256 RepID=UPI003F4A8DF2